MTTRAVFLWHMHQPDYREPDSGEPLLPWVRLHATRAYTDMADALERHPGVRAVCNWAPCLLLQLDAYVSGRSIDRDEQLARREASSLSPDERAHVLMQSFSVDWDRWVNPVPRYAELLHKRGLELKSLDLSEVQQRFSAQELDDLQVHFALAWMGFTARRDEPLVKQLLTKERSFSQAEKLALLDLQRAIASRIGARWAALAARGQIELTCSPLFHPILPLLIDTDAARRALPQLPLPPRFQHPEDAALHVTRGMDVAERFFGARPLGMWPSEGSVSPEAIGILAGAGLRWCATDQGNLERSRVSPDPGGKGPLHFRPWTIEVDAGAAIGRSAPEERGPKAEARASFSILFRDRELSDAIGFRYARVRADDAAQDLVDRLASRAGEEPLITVALDGENAWERYVNSGADFLDALYARLSSERRIRTVLPKDELRERPPRDRIDLLHSGSWIESSYRIWIGHPEDNAGWRLLGEARAAVAKAAAEGRLPRSAVDAARDALLPAEGSDWFWWYGDDFQTDNAAEFDALFRKHVAAGWLRLGMEVPEELGRPIIPPNKDRSAALDVLEEPRRLIEPQIDGDARGYFEWTGAGSYRPGRSLGGSMHQGAASFSALWFGFGKDQLFLRLDPRDGELPAATLRLRLLRARKPGLPAPGWERPEENQLEQRELNFAVVPRGDDQPILDASGAKCGHGRSGAIVELAVQCSTLSLLPQDRFGLVVRVLSGDAEVSRLPRYGELALVVPGVGFEAANWRV